MNITTTIDAATFRRPVVTTLASLAALVAGLAQRLVRAPLLLWSLVLAAALLAYFVHLLNAQVLRGEQLREQQRAAATRPAARLALVAGGQYQPANELLVTRQPIARR